MWVYFVSKNKEVHWGGALGFDLLSFVDVIYEGKGLKSVK